MDRSLSKVCLDAYVFSTRTAILVSYNISHNKIWLSRLLHRRSLTVSTSSPRSFVREVAFNVNQWCELGSMTTVLRGSDPPIHPLLRVASIGCSRYFWSPSVIQALRLLTIHCLMRDTSNICKSCLEKIRRLTCHSYVLLHVGYPLPLCCWAPSGKEIGVWPLLSDYFSRCCSITSINTLIVVVLGEMRQNVVIATILFNWYPFVWILKMTLFACNSGRRPWPFRKWKLRVRPCDHSKTSEWSTVCYCCTIARQSTFEVLLVWFVPIWPSSTSVNGRVK